MIDNYSWSFKDKLTIKGVITPPIITVFCEPPQGLPHFRFFF